MCVCVSVCAALMNGSVVNVEIRGQGSERWCGAAFNLPGHTDKFRDFSPSLRVYSRSIKMREKDIKKETEREILIKHAER